LATAAVGAVPSFDTTVCSIASTSAATFGSITRVPESPPPLTKVGVCSRPPSAIAPYARTICSGVTLRP
jgi:hypothetical protein